MKKLALTDFLKYRYPSALELSPDGRYLAFALKETDREGDGYRWNLWLCDLESGESRQITRGDAQRQAVWEDDTHVLYKTTELDEALRTRGHELIPVCPEVQGGLPTPRPPAERQRDGRVVNREGTDVTESYQAGAKLALKTALEQGCELAVLKERSPSCGSGEIYDGTFSRRLIPGDGVTAQQLRQAGIKVLGESRAETIQ